MAIYNKRGEPIFSTNQIDQGWNGTFEGEDASPNQYTYLISYRFTVNGQLFNESIRGSVSLVR